MHMKFISIFFSLVFFADAANAQSKDDNSQMARAGEKAFFCASLAGNSGNSDELVRLTNIGYDLLHELLTKLNNNEIEYIHLDLDIKMMYSPLTDPNIDFSIGRIYQQKRILALNTISQEMNQSGIRNHDPYLAEAFAKRLFDTNKCKEILK